MIMVMCTYLKVAVVSLRGLHHRVVTKVLGEGVLAEHALGQLDLEGDEALLIGVGLVDVHVV
jgi:hypothetical protein